MSVRTDERVSVSAFVASTDYERLLRLAREHERSVSGGLRLAIREHLQQPESREPDLKRQR